MIDVSKLTIESAHDHLMKGDFTAVKLTKTYLDIIAKARQRFDCPVAAYNVSGEYMMVCSAAKAGLLDKEAAMMESFDRDFAVRHCVAFHGIAERLELDYVILDCGEMPDGRLVLFEADIGGWIHATDPVDTFPYKGPVMQKAFDAFRTMLESARRARPSAKI